jgi:hypothetical protein
VAFGVSMIAALFFKLIIIIIILGNSVVLGEGYQHSSFRRVLMDMTFLALSDALREMQEKLQRLPVESTVIRLSTLSDALFAEDLSIARTVFAPHSVHCVSIDSISPFVWRRVPFALRLNVKESSGTGPDEALAVLESIAAHTVVVATLSQAGESSSVVLATDIAPSADGNSIVVSISLPEQTVAGAYIELTRITVAASPVDVPAGTTFPVRAVVVDGVVPPLTLQKATNPSGNYSYTPAIGTDGTIYCPLVDYSTLLLFGPQGEPLPPLDLLALGVSSKVVACAVDDRSRMLLLGAADFSDAKVYALHLDRREVLWTAPMLRCIGVATFTPKLGPPLALVTSYHGARLHVLRLSDGVELTQRPTGPCPTSVIADPASSSVFVSSSAGVSVFTYDAVNSVLHEESLLPSTKGRSHLLALVPPTYSDSHATLVAARTNDASAGSEIAVFSVPDRRLLRVERASLDGLPGAIVVSGIASDPYGKALVICRGGVSREVNVVAWPLPSQPTA